MEQLINFNGVKVLLTTGETSSEVQSYFKEADLIVAVHPLRIDVLKARAPVVIDWTSRPKARGK